MTRILTAALFAFVSTPASAGIGFEATHTAKGFGDSTLRVTTSGMDYACYVAGEVALEKATRRADRHCGGAGAADIVSEETWVTSERWNEDWYSAACSATGVVSYTCG